MATCSTAELFAQAACFSCLPDGQLQILELQLLCEISSTLSGGGGGGGGTVFCQSNFAGNGDPTGVVFPACDVAFYTQKDSVPAGVIWNWYDGVWH